MDSPGGPSDVTPSACGVRGHRAKRCALEAGPLHLDGGVRGDGIDLSIEPDVQAGWVVLVLGFAVRKAAYGVGYAGPGRVLTPQSAAAEERTRNELRRLGFGTAKADRMAAM